MTRGEVGASIPGGSRSADTQGPPGALPTGGL